MDVRGLHLHGVFEQRLQQAHHRRVAVALRAQTREVKIAVLQVALQLAGQRSDLAGAPVEPIQRTEQFAFAHHRRIHALAQQAFHLVLGEQVERIGHAHQQTIALAGQHDDAKTPRHGFGQALGQLVVELVVLELDEGNLQLLGQRREQAHLVDEAQIEHRAAELRATAFLVLQGQLQLGVTDQPGLDQQVAEANLALAHVLSHCVPPREAARSLAKRRALSSSPCPCSAIW